MLYTFSSCCIQLSLSLYWESGLKLLQSAVLLYKESALSAKERAFYIYILKINLSIKFVKR